MLMAGATSLNAASPASSSTGTLPPVVVYANDLQPPAPPPLPAEVPTPLPVKITIAAPKPAVIAVTTLTKDLEQQALRLQPSARS